MTGDAAYTLDVADFYLKGMPQVIAFVLTLSFLLLLVAFRSIVIPIKAILLNLLSTGRRDRPDGGRLPGGLAAGRRSGSSRARSSHSCPIFIFTILFGLSMDYHVFILTRIKEARDHGMTSNEAVARGISITAGTITSAAAIMVCVFAVFLTLPLTIIKQLGFGLAVAGPHRRDDRPLDPAARHDAAPRGVELVAAALARLAAARDDRGRGRRGRSPTARRATGDVAEPGPRRPAADPTA